MAELTMVAALNAALRDALAGDPRTLVFGEDVGELGGVFRVTEGLSPSSDGSACSTRRSPRPGSPGSAWGWRWRVGGRSPRCSSSFSYPALDQVISHLAKYRERTRGRVGVPAVIRIPSFGGIKGKEHHGESPETYYVHTAGLKVVVPSSPLDAYRLLRLSIDDPDPVIFLEPKSRYWSKETGEPTSDGPGIGRARTVRDGGSCVVIAYGAMVTRCLEAAEVLSAEDIEVSVLDLRSLVPLDVEAIGEAVRAIGRAVVVHEAPSRSGWAPRSWRGSSRRRSTSWRRRSRASPVRTCRTRRRRSNTDTCRASKGSRPRSARS